jgi:hypothetical protein
VKGTFARYYAGKNMVVAVVTPKAN